MKKLYFLIFTILISTASFGQVILAEDFSYPDGSLVANSAWVNTSGTAGTFLANSGQAVILQDNSAPEDVAIDFTSVAGDIYAGFDFSVDDLGAPISGTDFEYFAHFDFRARLDIQAPNNTGDFTVGIASNSSTGEVSWANDLDFGVTYRAILKFDQTGGTAQLWINPVNDMSTSISSTVSAPLSVSQFEFRQSNSSGDETVRVDNLMLGQTFNDVLVFMAQTNPSITITAPSSGTVFNPGTTNVDLTWTTANLTGNEFVNVIVNAGAPTSVAPTATPFGITTTDGASYNVTVELRDAGNMLLDTKMTDFSVGSLTTVADLAAVRADFNTNGPGAFYSIQSEPSVTYTRSTRNQKYIQDASAAILIDDDPGVITSVFNIGFTMSGLVGQVSEFNGVMQFNPIEDPTIAGNNPIIPEVVTLAQIVANQDDYESELVQINDVTFSDGDGVATFAASTSYNISDPSARLLAASIYRTNFSEADYIGELIPSGAIGITTFVGEFNGTPQITSRALADFSLSNDEFSINKFSIFPNPTNTGEVTISSVNASPIAVTVFDVLGKQVKNETISNNRLDVSNLKSGIYLLRLTQDEATSTKKLVIR
ncbi:T9SS type A sorting domain-containing protein [uncultured Winogradskyella sp.]|uniref:T9SS type A sorting domain-containing protein n=1 Tax=uncultured Winogradskyella sp. TaxID=395353 RepID=UPI00260975AA|nr:T9SS type A sorting domain-containing protein [uncultured Winogradskyella sp.]